MMLVMLPIFAAMRQPEQMMVMMLPIVWLPSVSRSQAAAGANDADDASNCWLT